MALPVEATPELEGEDAVRFLNNLNRWRHQQFEPHSVNIPMDIVRTRAEELRKQRIRSASQKKQHQNVRTIMVLLLAYWEG